MSALSVCTLFTVLFRCAAADAPADASCLASEEDEDQLLSVALLQANISRLRSGGMQPEQEGVFHLHIPKAAGSSFSYDADVIVTDSGRAFRSEEGCFYNAAGDERVISMVRNPHDHVVSMFRYCIYNRNFLNHGMEGVHAQNSGNAPFTGGPATDWEQDPEAMGALMEEWLRAWVGMLDAGTAHGHFNWQGVRPDGSDLNCYAPLNVQTQRFTCEDVNIWPEDLPTDLAIDNMHSLWFVGLVEEYLTSICLLTARAHGEMPPGCACDRRDEMVVTRSNSNDQTARPAMSDEVRELLDRITSEDQALYEAAVARFHADVAAAEAEYGVRILCTDEDE